MHDPVAGPRAYVGFGQPGAAPADEREAAPDRRPPGQQPAGRPGGAPGARPPRPAAVLVACVVTWASTAVVGLLMIGTVAALAASPDLLLDEVRRQNPEVGREVTRSTLVGATIGIGSAVVLWCAAAAAVAVFVLRGHAWARLTLAVSATVAAVGSAVLSVGSAAMLLPAAAAGTTAYCLLFRPEVRGWFSHP